jgi:hypothetical protein
MKPVKLGVLLRWALTILFVAASLFFLLTGFSTALLGDGAEPGELRRAWSFHAAFLFEIAMLFWLVSVVTFVSLRPGGLWRAVRGRRISPFKRWLYIMSLMASLVAFLVSNPGLLVTKIKINRCLEKGGGWVYSTNSCKFEKAP